MTSPNDEEAIRHVIRSMVEAFNHHDATRLAAMYTPAADLVTVGGEWFKGRQEIEAGMRSVFSSRAAGAALELVEASVRRLDEHVAIVHVKNLLRGLGDEAGRSLPEHVEFSLRVFVERDGVWQVDAMHNRRWEVR